MFNTWINKITFIVIVLIAFIDGGLVASQFSEHTPQSTASEAVKLEDIFEQKNSSAMAETVTEIAPIIQNVPFTSQAPYGVWDKPWDNYAEEACALMAAKWAKSEEISTANETANELLAIGEWEGQQFGTSKNTDSLQNLRILKEFLGLQAELFYDITRESLISALDQGKIIIIPVNGQTLANPHYGEPGPQFHTILVYAYDGETFLANDPGTAKGEAYIYDIQKILDSIQDLNGERRVIIISR